MLQEIELNHLLIAAIKASIDAGQAILDVYNSNDFQVNLKSDKTPLTLADREAHEVIKTHLYKTHIPALSEEGRDLLFDERKNWDLFWLVDPLDGTVEFIKQNDEFTVNIALVENSYPVFGVIYAPIFQTLYFGFSHSGSYKIEGIKPNEPFPFEQVEELISKSEKLPIIKNNPQLTITASRSHYTPETESFINEKRALFPDMKLISKGSSLKLCFIAEGVADLYPRLAQTFEWDTAAGQAIVEGAGRKIVDAESGIRLRYNKEELFNPWFICTK